MLSLFIISVKKNLGRRIKEFKTLDGSDRGPHAFFFELRVYIFGWWKYPSDRASAELNVNRRPALINE